MALGDQRDVPSIPFHGEGCGLWREVGEGWERVGWGRGGGGLEGRVGEVLGGGQGEGGREAGSHGAGRKGGIAGAEARRQGRREGGCRDGKSRATPGTPGSDVKSRPPSFLPSSSPLFPFHTAPSSTTSFPLPSFTAFTRSRPRRSSQPPSPISSAPPPSPPPPPPLPP